MSLHSLFGLAFLALANAQSPTTTSLEPLASKHFTYPNIPYQVTGDQGGIRGPQYGYNLCNSTTEGPNSNCQTLFMNSLADFCTWSSPKPNDTIGQSEAYEVAWCTKRGHGGRLIPDGSITGLQWLYAKNYVQVVGYIDQTKVNLDAQDMGGELDPHGADEQGNPLGALAYTNGFGQTADGFASQLSSGSNGSSTYTQVIEWIDFIGGNMFCMKMCNPNDPNAAQLCNHIYDEIGCTYNALADYNKINGTFEVCDSDDMTPPGVYTDAAGQTTTWFQPSVAPFSPPYTPTIPASSNCHTFASTQLFGVPTSTATSTVSGSAGSGAAGTRSGSSSGPAATGTSGAITLAVPAAVFAAALFGTVVTLLA